MREVRTLRDIVDPLTLAAVRNPGGALHCAVGFFTCWALLIHALPPPPSVQGAETMRWMRWWLSWGVTLGGGYITYVHPRRLFVAWPAAGVFCVAGPALWLIDAAFHHLPFIWTVVRGGRPGGGRIAAVGGAFGVAAFFTLYLALGFDPQVVYGLDPSTVIALLLLTVTLSLGSASLPS